MGELMIIVDKSGNMRIALEKNVNHYIVYRNQGGNTVIQGANIFIVGNPCSKSGISG